MTINPIPYTQTGNTIYFTTTTTPITVTDATFYWKAKPVDITTNAVRLRAGWVAQCIYRDNIVWESHRTYKTRDKAIKVAERERILSVEALFQ